jgi:hypothetical protein
MGSAVDMLLGSPWQDGEIEVRGQGIFNTEFAEDAEGRRRGDGTEMWIGKHGRG